MKNFTHIFRLLLASCACLIVTTSWSKTEVNVQTAGTLSSLISTSEKELKVTGFINGSDIKFIRQLISSGKAKAQPKPTNLIPAPVAYSVRPGSISSKDMASLHEKVRISEKALLRRLGGRKLTDWQLKSAYWIELGKKGAKIVAADEEGVFYARQTLKMMACLDSSLTCCTILDWPRFRYRGVMLDESRHFQGKDFVMKQLDMMALLKMNRFHFHLILHLE